MGIKLKITLAFSAVFILLSLFSAISAISTSVPC